MRIRCLGASGLRVSELCLGAMTFGTAGWGCDQATALQMIDRFLDTGGNFIDTADAYAEGRSEEICGKALRTRRTKVALATKCTMPVGHGANDRGASRKHIREACDASLHRLQTDYIDLYQVHCEDLATPLEETLQALDDLVRAGKVLYVGCSNYRAYRLAKALAVADRHGWARFISLQPQYNLLVRGIEREHFSLCVEEGVGIITWSPLAAGMLTGKIAPDSRPADSRLAQREMPHYEPYFTPRAFEVVDAMRQIAGEVGCSIAALALAWQLAKPEIASVIIGARTRTQLDENLAATSVQLGSDVVQRLDALTALPAEYPYQFIGMVQTWLRPRPVTPA
ncbi:MAG TPA: aldo/keto reductase [Candidatus Kryptonia bacterium]|nr:aldo/keto reductase [Candidatus Kryptonia bacterium]